MPSIGASDFSSGTSWSIPWKGLAVGLVMLSAGGYAWYQYERLHPKPAPIVQSPVQKIVTEFQNDPVKALDTRVGLSPDQKTQVADILKDTTNPLQRIQRVAKVLKPEQKEKLKALREQFAGERRKRSAEQKTRMAKYFPGGDMEFAKQAAERMRADREARKQAAGQAGANIKGK